MLRANSLQSMKLGAVEDERGAAVVEFAIIFPVLIVLLFGVIDFGRAFFLRNNLFAAAREGARSGAVMTTPCTSAMADSMKSRVRQYLTPLGIAVTNSNITVSTPGSCAAGVATNVAVRVSGVRFTPITPVFRLINYNTSLLTLSVSALYRWELSPVP